MRWVLAGLAVLAAGVVIAVVTSDDGARGHGPRTAPDPPAAPGRHLHAVIHALGARGVPGQIAVARDAGVWIAYARAGHGGLARVDGRAARVVRWARPPIRELLPTAAGPYLAYASASEVGTLDGRGRPGRLRYRVPGDVRDIAVDRLARIWFTDRRRAVVGRVSAGKPSVLELPVGAHPRLGDIVLAARERIWFRDDRGRIGHVEPEGGAVALFRVPGGPPTGPASRMAGGARGEIWFTGRDGIGTITDSGRSRLVVGAGATPPGAVILGPDGDVWSLATHGPRLLRIAPDGSVTAYELDLPRGAELVDIARDVYRGALWITAARPREVLEVPLPDLRPKVGAGGAG